MVLDFIPQPLPVHFFGSRPQPPTSPIYIGTLGRGRKVIHTSIFVCLHLWVCVEYRWVCDTLIYLSVYQITCPRACVSAVIHMCCCVSVHVCSIEVCVWCTLLSVINRSTSSRACSNILCDCVCIYVCECVCERERERGVCVIHRSMYVSVGIFAQECAVVIRMVLCVCVCACVCARVWFGGVFVLHWSIYLSIYLSNYQSIYLSIYLCIYLSIYLSVYWNTCSRGCSNTCVFLCFCIFAHLSIYPSIGKDASRGVLIVCVFVMYIYIYFH